MERVVQIKKLLLRSQRLPLLIMSVTLAILAGVILMTTQQTRVRIREQIVGRDGSILHAVALMHLSKDAAEGDLVGSPEDPGNQLTVALETSRLQGVLGVRLFDVDGRFVEAFPGYVSEAGLKPADLPALKRLAPVSHFYPAMPTADAFLPETNTLASASGAEPVLEVNVPLHTKAGGPLLGIVQFITKGDGIAQEFARLDSHLLRQALVAFVAGALILVVAIGWSFRRLNKAHQLLAERTHHLLQANKELALAAKTSAVGAVTSHLIHGLRNPLAGLQNFVASLGGSLADNPDADVQLAMATARRMQTMINEVVAVLREEEGAGQYEIALAELVELISAKVQSLAHQRGIDLATELYARAVLPNRVANLSALILANLLQNALEATPRGKTVTLSLRQEPEAVVCEVRDEGLGFPAGENVFAPCQSIKEGGSGIGLAISKQLANHLGAGLELKSSTPQGCVFVLTLPASLWSEKTKSITVTL